MLQTKPNREENEDAAPNGNNGMPKPQAAGEQADLEQQEHHQRQLRQQRRSKESLLSASSTGTLDEVDEEEEEDEEDVEVPDCWICHQGATSPTDPLLFNVCNCRGTMGFVHQSCIDKWVFDQKEVRCPSCKALYFIESLYSGATPQGPEGYLDSLLFVTQHFFLPIFKQSLQIVFACLFRYVFLPCAYGIYYYFPKNLPSWQHKLAVGVNHLEDIVEATTSKVGGGLDSMNRLELGTNWGMMWLYGIVAATTYRQLVSGYQNFALYFGVDMGGPERPPKNKSFSMVEIVMSALANVRFNVGCYCGLTSMLLNYTEETTIVFFSTFIFRHNFLTNIVIAAILAIGVVIRYNVPRKKLSDVRKRFTEPLEKRDTATEKDINIWYITFLYDFLLFSVVLPIFGGIGIHYAMSPYCADPPVLADLIDITFLSLVVYWAVGSITLMIIVKTEAIMVVPLFAPGVDLFFIRSVDLENDDVDIDGWDFVHAQVYDTDPLKVMWEFFKVCAFEVFFVGCFVRIPISGTFALREFFFADTSTISLPLKFANSDIISYWTVTVTVLLAGTLLMCFNNYPLQRCALFFIRPIVFTLAEVVQLEDFLFDKERLAILDNWLDRGIKEEPLRMPLVPLEHMFVRRERWLPKEQLPKYLGPRLFLFAALLFIFCSSAIWLPFIGTAFVALSYTQRTIGVVSIGLLAPFVLTDPKRCVGCFFQVCIIVIVFAFSGFATVFKCIGELYSSIDIIELGKQTHDYVHLVRRRVVPMPSPSSSERELRQQ